MRKRIEGGQNATKSHKHRIRRSLLWRRLKFIFQYEQRKHRTHQPSWNRVGGLDLVEVGQRARIIQIDLRQSIHYKLADMGITPGAEILVQEKAPFGGPILIRIRGTMLALRPSEASCILVAPVTS